MNKDDDSSEVCSNVSYWGESAAGRVPVEIRDNRVNFKCLAEKCETPCCGPFAGLDHSLAPCFVSSFSDLYLLDDDVARLLKAGRGDLLEHTPEGFRLRLNDDLSCSAFQNGLCSIHSLRPAVCRAFPFDFDVFAGLVLISKCPGVNSGWSDPGDFPNAVEALTEVYERWIAETRRRVGSRGGADEE
jgi:Fe-S-cluster containining protein